MRTSIILTRKHGATKFALAADPTVSITEQTDGIRELLAGGNVHPEFAEVQIWDSTHGLQRTLKFHSPAEKKADDERIARENKAQADALAKAEKKDEKKSAKVQPKKEAEPKAEAPAEKKADEPTTQATQEPVTDL